MALLDDKGCAKLKQAISGPFNSPKIDTLNAAGSTITGPVSGLFNKSKRFIQGGRCEVFYNGVLQQPSE